MVHESICLQSAAQRDLHVHLLGTFTIRHDGMVLPLPRQSVARSLLAYLLLHAERPVSRLQLLGQFWPDLPEQRARRALSQALWHIRRIFLDLLQTDYESIHITPGLPLWVDAITFETLVAAATAAPATAHDLQHAVSLYRGDLLEGCYEEWVLAERRRLQAIYHQALAQLLRLEKEAGRYDHALEWALQLSQSDPLNETIHREIMQLYYLLDRPSAALQQFSTCTHILRAELDVDPASATVALAHEITRRNRQAASAYLPEPESHLADIPILAAETIAEVPFLGRSAERHWLMRRVRGVFVRRGGVVLVEGESGVGKSRLVQEVARDLEWRGTHVLWSTSSERAPSAVYGPLVTALTYGLTPLRSRQLVNVVDSVWRHVLCPLLPGLVLSNDTCMPAVVPQATLHQAILAAESDRLDARRPLDTIVAPDWSGEREDLVDAFTHLLIGWSRIAPLVLVLDDFQSADAASWQFLKHVAQYLSKHRVIIIALYRSDEVRARSSEWEQLQALNCLEGCARLPLPRLNDTACDELIRHSLGQAAPAVTECLYRATGGNPRFVLELLRCLYDQGQLYQDAQGSWQMSGEQSTAPMELPLPATIEQLLIQRVTALSLEARQALSTIAVLGVHTDFELVHAVSGLALRAMLGALQELLQHDLLVETAHRYHFSHNIMHQVIARHTSAAERIRLHRRAGHVLEAKDPSQVELLAYHFTEGQVWDQALHYGQQAGACAMARGTPTLAVDYYNTTIDIVQVGHVSIRKSALFALLSGREQALAILGDRAAQAADLQTLAELVEEDPVRLTYLQQRRARLLAKNACFDDAEAAARAAIAVAQEQSNTRLQVDALTTLAQIMYVRGAPLQSIQSIQSAIARYSTEAAHASLPHQQRMKKETNHHTGDQPKTPNVASLVPWCLGGVDNGLFRGDDLPRDQEAWVRQILARALCAVDGARTARGEAEKALMLFESLSDWSGQAATCAVLGDICVEQGCIAEAKAYYERAADLAKTMADREVAALSFLGRSRLLAWNGQIGEALRDCEQACAIALALGDRRLTAGTRIQHAAISARYLGNYVRATQLCEAALEYTCSVKDGYSEGICLTLLGDIACRQGDLKTARGYLEAALETLERRGLLRDQALAHICFARLTLEEQQAQEALVHIGIADAIAQKVGEHPLMMRCLVERSRVLLATGQAMSALACTAEAIDRLQSGVEQPYLIYLAHFYALVAIGETVAARTAIEQAHYYLEQLLDSLSPEQRCYSCEHVAEHQAIVAAWQSLQPQCITLRMPRNAARRGRRLRDEEQVVVTWTVATPEDEAIDSKVARRRHRLERLLAEAAAQDAAPTAAHLAHALRVGQRTIEQDLHVLREQDPGM